MHDDFLEVELGETAPIKGFYGQCTFKIEGYGSNSDNSLYILKMSLWLLIFAIVVIDKLWSDGVGNEEYFKSEIS